jgi:hypothetical protein
VNESSTRFATMLVAACLFATPAALAGDDDEPAPTDLRLLGLLDSDALVRVDLSRLRGVRVTAGRRTVTPAYVGRSGRLIAPEHGVNAPEVPREPRPLPIDPIRHDLNLQDTFDFRWGFEPDLETFGRGGSAMIWSLEGGELVRGDDP